MRRFLVAVAVALSAVGSAACSTSGGSAAISESDAPALSQVSSAPAPASTRTPGPPVTAVCPLLKASEVADAVGLNAPTAREEKLNEAVSSCRYHSGNRWLLLLAYTEPASGTADSIASRTLVRYTGTLQQVPGVGDAAYYAGDTNTQFAVAVRLEGSQARVVQLTGFLGKTYQDELISLVRIVLGRS